jgi:hypothetical protein
MRESLKFLNTRIVANVTTENKAEVVRGKRSSTVDQDQITHAKIVELLIIGSKTANVNMCCKAVGS